MGVGQARPRDGEIVNEALLVYVTCPRCRRQIRHPFSRQSGPIVYVHHRPQRSPCRLLVWPAMTGDRHEVRLVPETQSLEEALTMALSGVTR